MVPKIKRKPVPFSKVPDFLIETTLTGMLRFHYSRKPCPPSRQIKRRLIIMLKTHNQYFKELISARTEAIMRQVLFNNKRYRELAGEISETQRALTEHLDPEFLDLVDRYEETESEREAIAIPAVYRQGFLDGVKAAKLLSRYGMIHKFFGK
jgi:hypothetical protein